MNAVSEGESYIEPEENTMRNTLVAALILAGCSGQDKKPVSHADDAEITAFTYRSEISRPERKPSRRYLGLLLAGARERGLPAAYVERLRAWPLAVDERDRQLPLL